jgi:hypothetical protein
MAHDLQHDLPELIRMLPDFIDSVQGRRKGDDATAALSMLGALPLGADTSVMERNGKRVEWAITVHGFDRVKNTASLARDSDDPSIRKSKSAELADLLKTEDADDRVNAILERLQEGQLPTEQERQILEIAKDLFQS